jgi:hypothetical protein
MALGHSCRRPLGVEATSPPFAELIVVRVSCALDRVLSCRCYQRAKGSSRGPFCRSEVWGVEKSTGGGGAVLAAEGVPSGLRRLVLN